MSSMNKSLMSQMEKKEFEVSRASRPVSPGGRTLSVEGTKASKGLGRDWVKEKVRAGASAAIKAADKARRARYNASRK